MNKSYLMTLAILVFALTACETADDKTLEQARACTDNATKLSFTNSQQAATDATTCNAIIANAVETKDVIRLKFGNLLLQEQKMNQIAQMASAARTNTGGIDGINTVFTIFFFTSSNNATEIKRLGDSSNSSGLKLIGNLIQLSTVLNGISALTLNNPASAATAINNLLSGTQAQKDAAAAAIVAMQQSACASVADQNSTDPNNLCNKSKGMLGSCATTDSTCIINQLNTYADGTH